MLPVPWLNACIPQTQYLSDGFLATWRQKDRPGVRLDREGVFLSPLSMKESKQPLNGYMGERMFRSQLQQGLGEGEGQGQWLPLGAWEAQGG